MKKATKIKYPPSGKEVYFIDGTFTNIGSETKNYHECDICKEVFNSESSEPALDLKKLKQLCERKIRQIYIDIINDTVSVADRKN